MKYIVSIYLWLAGIIYYTGFLILALLLSFLFPVEKIDPVIKKILRGFFRAVFIKVETNGLENIDPGRAYIFMINHISFFDIPLVGGFVPGFVRGIEASRQHKWPLYGWVMRRLGNIPVERTNVYASIKSFGQAEKYLRQGKSLIIFPEGGRTSTGDLIPFKKLPFHLVKKTEIEIIPVAIKGMFEINNKTSLSIKPGKVLVKFGASISKEIIQKLDTVALRDYTKEKIRKLLVQD